MPFRSSKAYSILPISWVPNLGIDLSRPASQIEDNALATAINFIYDANSQGVLVARAGLRCVTTSALPAPIRQLHHYVKSATTSYIIGVSGDKVKKLNVAGTGWDDVYTLPNATVVPSFLNFNGKLLIACGSDSGIAYWDGTTTGHLDGSPKATAIIEVVNRVAANHKSEPDSVYLSAAENETDWNTSGGQAQALKAGFGDGLNVNGFAVLYETLVVSKTGGSRKTMYAYDLSGTPTAWKENRQLLSPGNAAVNPDSIQAVGDKVYFIDSGGVKGLLPPQVFGSITTDPILGGRVNRVLANYTVTAQSAQLRFSPSSSSIFIIVDAPSGNKILAFSTTTGAFTELFFGQDTSGQMLTSLDADGVVFFAGKSGYLYALGTDSRDELAPGVLTEYAAIAKSRLYQGSGHGLVLRQTVIDVEYVSQGSLRLEVYAGDKVALGTYVSYGSSNEDTIFDAETPIYSAEYAVGGVAATEIVETARVRSHRGLQFLVRCLNGARIVLNGLTAETAVLQR